LLFTLRQDEQRRFVLQLHRVRVFRDPAAAASEADCKEREGKKEDGRFLVSLFLQLPTIFHVRFFLLVIFIIFFFIIVSFSFSSSSPSSSPSSFLLTILGFCFFGGRVLKKKLLNLFTSFDQTKNINQTRTHPHTHTSTERERARERERDRERETHTHTPDFQVTLRCGGEGEECVSL
jgi:hypothetical protein